MQLAHLIPHLDAEIDRLQRARDLLALVPSNLMLLPSVTITADVTTNKRARSSLSAAEAKPTEAPAAESAAKLTAADLVSSASAFLSLPVRPLPALPVKERRVRSFRATLRPERRKVLALEDTALRGSVPAGPVVVSAEEARKSQASKTAQASRAAEVKKAGADFISALGWRSRPTDTQKTDAFLQRLMHIGEDDQEPQGGTPFGLGRGASFKELQAQLALKS